MRRYRNFKQRRRERRGYDVRRKVYSNDPERNSQIRYPSNYVKTTRYNIITFLPKNLWEQFHRVANIFFVVMMILSITPISPVIPGPQVAAVTIILAFQACKDAYEDYKRYLSDIEINARKAHSVVREKDEIVEKPWSDIRVGDILRVDNNTEIPADLLLLSSSNLNGQCFLETANLDGESNLKLRAAHPRTVEANTIQEIQNLSIEVDADEPCRRLYEFDGSIILNEEEELPLTIDNFLHRGTTLKNTEYVYGLVLYTGHQTKYMLNVSVPRHKMSKLESILNRCILAIIIFLVIMCVVSAVIGVVVYEYGIAEDHWYIQFDDQTGEATDTLLAILTFIVVYGNLVPLSLYVNLEITRLILAKIMETDWKMFDRDRKRTPIARSTNLMEELGQIDYIFSDKTGTLTSNEMIFRVVAVGEHTFGEIPAMVQGEEFSEEEYLRKAEEESRRGEEEMEEGRNEKVKDVGPIDPNLAHFLEPRNRGGQKMNSPKKRKDMEMEVYGDEDLVVEGGGGEEDFGSDVKSMFLSMAICNSVVPAYVNEEIVYQSSSPDETALVLGASRADYTLVSRSVDECTVKIFGEEMTFETLAVNEFTSERRMMSVVVGMPDGSIRLLLKGADEAVFKRATSQGNAQEKADEFAVGGLRTLVFAQRVIPKEEFDVWAAEWNQARLASENRKEIMLEVASKIERDVHVVGTTGIEDRLQDAVPQTIEDLMKANIRVWVLTGDKGMTAINIAETCKLIKPGHKILRVKVDEASDLQKIPDLLQEMIETSENEFCALVIDGSALEYILENHLEDDFVHLTKSCASVVCCRSTPIQKKQMVTLMKSKLSIRTMAIGDGANDVAMIQAAHVGVGVMGNEGMQAVMSGDFVIGQFRFLRRLLLLHGRWDYQRIGFMVCYVVYKNVFLTLIPLWFAFFSMWSGEIYLDPWIRTMWNFLFTAMPIIFYSILEQDLPAELILQYPQLYMEGQANHSFNARKFLMWFVFSLWDGIVCFFGTIATNYGLGEAVNSDGYPGDYWSVATLTYTVMCIVCNLHLFIHTRHWNGFIQWSYWLTLISWFLFILFYCTEVCVFLDVPWMYWVIYQLYESPLFWLCLPVLSWLALLPDLVILFVRRTYYPKPYHILQEVANTDQWKAEHPQTGRWCCEQKDCCCHCGRKFCWCAGCCGY